MSVLRRIAEMLVVTEERTPVEELLELAAWRPEWHADAACREHPEINFFPERGESTVRAKAVCRSCLVAGECRNWAMAQGPTLAGIWAGTTDRERRRLRAGAAA